VQHPPSPLSISAIISRIRIHQGILSLNLPIGKARKAKEWIDKLNTDMLSVPEYKTELEAFID
jgi:hypothetical protein